MKRKYVKTFEQYYPNSEPTGISYYDNDQDCFMNDVIEEDEETFKKGEICVCDGEGCIECDGIGFRRLNSDEDLD